MSETPRFGHAPINMRRASDDFDDINALGDFHVGKRDAETGITYIAMAHPSPTGQGWTFVHLPVYRESEAKPKAVAWQWDGNVDRPTLSPSIHTHGHWHGFVRAGQMVEA